MTTENMKKVVANLHDKTEYVTHIRNINQALNHGLLFKNVYRVIIFNQNAWLKSYINMNRSRKKSKKWFWKIFF